jgi:hypothetical protein
MSASQSDLNTDLHKKSAPNPNIRHIRSVGFAKTSADNIRQKGRKCPDLDGGVPNYNTFGSVVTLSRYKQHQIRDLRRKYPKIHGVSNLNVLYEAHMDQRDHSPNSITTLKRLCRGCQ